MRRIVVTLVVALCAAAVAAGAGSAGVRRASADPVATASAFARAVMLGDVRACTSIGGALAESLRSAGIPCADFVRMMPVELDESAARATFRDVEEAANEMLVSWNGWMPKRGAVETLVRELRVVDSSLTVRSGRGAAAARKARAGVVVVDVASTPARLVLHTRARSGQVWTSVIRPGKRAVTAPSGLRGAPLFDPVGPGSRVIAAGAGHATVVTPLRNEGDGAMLIGVGDAGLVDLMLFGGALPSGGLAAEAADPAVVGQDIVTAWTGPTMGGVCLLAGGRLDGSTDGWCAMANPFASGAVDVGLHAYDPPVAGEATLLDVTVHVEGQGIGLAHLVTHDAAGTHLHGLYVDVIALGALSARVSDLPL